MNNWAGGTALHLFAIIATENYQLGIDSHNKEVASLGLVLPRLYLQDILNLTELLILLQSK